MKNLIIYINPEKKFVKDYAALARVQIDNSLSLGWKADDILFVMNYPWEYNGVKSIVIEDEHYCAVRPRSINTTTIPFLIDEGIIKEGEIYWNHDFDAYQLNKIKDSELGLDGFDCGLTDYGWKDRWCMGSYFVKSSSKDIFEKAKEIIYKNVEDERAVSDLTQNPDIARRCKRMNITYNFGMRYVESNYKIAKKPLKILHFHPHYKTVYTDPYKWEWTWDVFVNGKNGLNKPLVNKRLLEIFKHNGIN